MDFSSRATLLLHRNQSPNVNFQLGNRFINAKSHSTLKNIVGIADKRGTFYVYDVTKQTSLGRDTDINHGLIEQYSVILSTADDLPQPIRKSWTSWEFHEDDGVIFVQEGSNRILFSSLARLPGQAQPVFLFGAHQDEVLCLAKDNMYLASGGADSVIKLWSLDSGDMVGQYTFPDHHHITCLIFAGTFLLLAGTATGEVLCLDLSTGRPECVQRFLADDSRGPIHQLAIRLTPERRAAAAFQPTPRPMDGGGVLLGTLGLAWRGGGGGGATLQSGRRRGGRGGNGTAKEIAATGEVDIRVEDLYDEYGDGDGEGEYDDDASKNNKAKSKKYEQESDVLLAVTSTVGWIHIFQPCVTTVLPSPALPALLTSALLAVQPTITPRSPSHWRQVSSAQFTGSPLVSFSPDGSHLLTSSGLLSGKLSVLDAVTLSVVQEVSFDSPLVGSGFLSDGIALTVMTYALAAGIQIRLFAAPAAAPPRTYEVHVPYLDPEVARKRQVGEYLLQGGLGGGREKEGKEQLKSSTPNESPLSLMRPEVSMNPGSQASEFQIQKLKQQERLKAFANSPTQWRSLSPRRMRQGGGGEMREEEQGRKKIEQGNKKMEQGNKKTETLENRKKNKGQMKGDEAKQEGEQEEKDEEAEVDDDDEERHSNYISEPHQPTVQDMVRFEDRSLINPALRPSFSPKAREGLLRVAEETARRRCARRVEYGEEEGEGRKSDGEEEGGGHGERRMGEKTKEDGKGKEREEGKEIEEETRKTQVNDDDGGGGKESDNKKYDTDDKEEGTKTRGHRFHHLCKHSKNSSPSVTTESYNNMSDSEFSSFASSSTSSPSPSASSSPTKTNSNTQNKSTTITADALAAEEEIEEQLVAEAKGLGLDPESLRLKALRRQRLWDARISAGLSAVTRTVENLADDDAYAIAHGGGVEMATEKDPSAAIARKWMRRVLRRERKRQEEERLRRRRRRGVRGGGQEEEEEEEEEEKDDASSRQGKGRDKARSKGYQEEGSVRGSPTGSERSLSSSRRDFGSRKALPGASVSVGGGSAWRRGRDNRDDQRKKERGADVGDWGKAMQGRSLIGDFSTTMSGFFAAANNAAGKAGGAESVRSGRSSSVWNRKKSVRGVESEYSSSAAATTSGGGGGIGTRRSGSKKVENPADKFVKLAYKRTIGTPRTLPDGTPKKLSAALRNEGEDEDDWEGGGRDDFEDGMSETGTTLTGFTSTTITAYREGMKEERRVGGRGVLGGRGRGGGGRGRGGGRGGREKEKGGKGEEEELGLEEDRLEEVGLEEEKLEEERLVEERPENVSMATSQRGKMASFPQGGSSMQRIDWWNESRIQAENEAAAAATGGHVISSGPSSPSAIGTLSLSPSLPLPLSSSLPLSLSPAAAAAAAAKASSSGLVRPASPLVGVLKVRRVEEAMGSGLGYNGMDSDTVGKSKDVGKAGRAGKDGGKEKGKGKDKKLNPLAPGFSGEEEEIEVSEDVEEAKAKERKAKGPKKVVKIAEDIHKRAYFCFPGGGSAFAGGGVGGGGMGAAFTTATTTNGILSTTPMGLRSSSFTLATSEQVMAASAAAAEGWKRQAKSPSSAESSPKSNSVGEGVKKDKLEGMSKKPNEAMKSALKNSVQEVASKPLSSIKSALKSSAAVPLATSNSAPVAFTPSSFRNVLSLAELETQKGTESLPDSNQALPDMRPAYSDSSRVHSDSSSPPLHSPSSNHSPILNTPQSNLHTDALLMMYSRDVLNSVEAVRGTPEHGRVGDLQSPTEPSAWIGAEGGGEGKEQRGRRREGPRKGGREGKGEGMRPLTNRRLLGDEEEEEEDVGRGEEEDEVEREGGKEEEERRLDLEDDDDNQWADEDNDEEEEERERERVKVKEKEKEKEGERGRRASGAQEEPGTSKKAINEKGSTKPSTRIEDEALVSGFGGINITVLPSTASPSSTTDAPLNSRQRLINFPSPRPRLSSPLSRSHSPSPLPRPSSPLHRVHFAETAQMARLDPDSEFKVVATLEVPVSESPGKVRLMEDGSFPDILSHSYAVHLHSSDHNISISDHHPSLLDYPGHNQTASELDSFKGHSKEHTVAKSTFFGGSVNAAATINNTAAAAAMAWEATAAKKPMDAATMLRQEKLRRLSAVAAQSKRGLTKSADGIVSSHPDYGFTNDKNAYANYYNINPFLASYYYQQQQQQQFQLHQQQQEAAFSAMASEPTAMMMSTQYLSKSQLQSYLDPISSALYPSQEGLIIDQPNQTNEMELTRNNNAATNNNKKDKAIQPKGATIKFRGFKPNDAEILRQLRGDGRERGGGSSKKTEREKKVDAKSGEEEVLSSRFPSNAPSKEASKTNLTNLSSTKKASSGIAKGIRYPIENATGISSISGSLIAPSASFVNKAAAASKLASSSHASSKASIPMLGGMAMAVPVKQLTGVSVVLAAPKAPPLLCHLSPAATVPLPPDVSPLIISPSDTSEVVEEVRGRRSWSEASVKEETSRHGSVASNLDPNRWMTNAAGQDERGSLGLRQEPGDSSLASEEPDSNRRYARLCSTTILLRRLEAMTKELEESDKASKRGREKREDREWGSSVMKDSAREDSARNSVQKRVASRMVKITDLAAEAERLKMSKGQGRATLAKGVVDVPKAVRLYHNLPPVVGQGGGEAARDTARWIPTGRKTDQDEKEAREARENGRENGREDGREKGKKKEKNVTTSKQHSHSSKGLIRASDLQTQKGVDIGDERNEEGEEDEWVTLDREQWRKEVCTTSSVDIPLELNPWEISEQLLLI